MQQAARDSGRWRIRNGNGTVRWPAWVLAAVLPLSGLAILAVGSFDGRVLVFPIQLTPGVPWETKFRTTRGVRHVVQLEVDRTIPAYRLQCLLGQVPFREPCANEPVVDLQWTLRRGSAEIASGDSKHAVANPGPDRVVMLIGQFEASFATEYVLELASRRDGSELAGAKPRVVVQFHPEVTKGFTIVAPLIAFATVLASLPLAVMALVALGRARRRKPG